MRGSTAETQQLTLLNAPASSQTPKFTPFLSSAGFQAAPKKAENLYFLIPLSHAAPQGASRQAHGTRTPTSPARFQFYCISLLNSWPEQHLMKQHFYSNNREQMLQGGLYTATTSRVQLTFPVNFIKRRWVSSEALHAAEM